MKFDFSVPKERKSYYFFKSLAKGMLKLKYDIRCEGIENIPDEGGIIIAANHISFADPVMIVACCPRQCHFMAKSELFTKPVFGHFLALMNAFPVKRGTSDVNALSFAEKIIEKGWILGIFPEGARSKDMLPKKAKSGAAYLVRKTGADVIPVSIYRNPEDKNARPEISIRFGKPVRAEEFGFDADYNPQQIRAAAARIMQEITGLWNKGHIK